MLVRNEELGLWVFLFVNEESKAHTKWNCKYYIVFTPKYSRKEYTKNYGVHSKPNERR